MGRLKDGGVPDGIEWPVAGSPACINCPHMRRALANFRQARYLDTVLTFGLICAIFLLPLSALALEALTDWHLTYEWVTLYTLIITACLVMRGKAVWRGGGKE